MSQTSTLRKTVEDLKFNLEIYNELNKHLKIVELNNQDEAVRKINHLIFLLGDYMYLTIEDAQLPKDIMHKWLEIKPEFRYNIKFDTNSIIDDLQSFISQSEQ